MMTSSALDPRYLQPSFVLVLAGRLCSFTPGWNISLYLLYESRREEMNFWSSLSWHPSVWPQHQHLKQKEERKGHPSIQCELSLQYLHRVFSPFFSQETFLLQTPLASKWSELTIFTPQVGQWSRHCTVYADPSSCWPDNSSSLISMEGRTCDATAPSETLFC